MTKSIKKKIIKIVLASVTLGIAILIEHFFSFKLWQLLLIYMVPYLICGFDVIKEAIEGIFEGELLGEDFLMTLATLGAMFIGFLPNANPMFAEGSFVMIFFAIGELFEEIAEGKTEKSIENLMEIRPDFANKEINGKVKKINPQNVKINDIIFIMPGEKVPLDGIVVDGKSSVNTSALTGESIPIDIKEGDTISSGSVNLTSTLKVKVTRKYEESTASKIIDLVKSLTAL